MTSVDDLFRKPPSTSSVSAGSKRKFPGHTSNTNFYKSAKVTTNGTPRKSAVEDENGDENDDDIAAGPSLPPETDEDEEGRFFGSGVSADTRDALDYVEGADGEGDTVAEEVIDGAWLRKMAVGFERKINKNAELRARFEGEPEKYVRLAFCF
jgi:beta-catenin-like protein 1